MGSVVDMRAPFLAPPLGRALRDRREAVVEGGGTGGQGTPPPCFAWSPSPSGEELWAAHRPPPALFKSAALC